MDNRLTYLYIRDLKACYHHSLDFLRHLTSISWGADKRPLLELFIALALSKLDYESTTYERTYKSYPLLDSFQNDGPCIEGKS